MNFPLLQLAWLRKTWPVVDILSTRELFAKDSRIALRTLRIDRTWKLGEGAAHFEAAKRALLHGEMFNLGWVTLYGRSIPLTAGQIYGVVYTLGGLRTISVAHLSRIHEEANQPGTKRLTLVCRTTKRHPMIGTERFMVTHDLQTNEVYYRIRSRSRVAPLLLPVQFLIRAFQRRFAGDSYLAVKKAVERSLSEPDASARKFDVM